MKEYLPYIVSIVTAIISGIASYMASKKQFKEDIKRLEKQHELDIEKERELFKIEKEKIEIEHKHQIELIQKEAESKINSDIMKTLFTEAMKNPDVQRQISQGTRNGNRRNNRR